MLSALVAKRAANNKAADQDNVSIRSDVVIVTSVLYPPLFLQLIRPNWSNFKPSHHNQLPSSAWFEHVFSSTLHPTLTLYRS